MTQKQKIEMYENFLHKISVYCTAMENDGIKELASNADRWSYAHRQGNGEISDKETQRLIDWAFRTLCNTPETDAKIRRRQREYSKKNARPVQK
jgi:hypothetical protein